MNDNGWVLIADGSPRPGNQGRATVAAVRALAAGGYRAAVTVSSKFSIAARSRYCDRRVPVPPVAEEDFVDAVKRELSTRSYLTCLPASDAALIALEGTGRPRPVSTEAELLDKEHLARKSESAGIPAPESRHFDSRWDLMAAASDLDYPVVVKPTLHTYSPYRVDSPAALARKMVQEGPVVVQPFIDEPIRVVSGVMWEGKILAPVHQVWLRIWPTDCGAASASITVAPDLEMEERLRILLSGYEGVFNAQFLGPYLLDVHPRIYVTHSLAMAAGANQVSLYCDLLRGEKVEPVRGQEGVLYRWIEGDVRHAVHQVRKRKMSWQEAARILRPRRHVTHSIESWRDPGPVLARLRYSARRITMSPDERRADREAVA